jgi:hypothetical protein
LSSFGKVWIGYKKFALSKLLGEEGVHNTDYGRWL